MKHGFRTGLQDVEVFGNPSLTACKRAVIRKDKESGVGSERRKLPFTMDMIQNTIRHHTPVRDKKTLMLLTAMQLAYFGLFRASELVPETRISDVKGRAYTCHALRAADVNFQLSNKKSVNFCDIAKHPLSDISSVKITLQSAKNDQFRIGHDIWFGRVAVGVDIITVLYVWAQQTSHTPTSKLMSFVSGQGTVTFLKYDNLRNAIKDCARRLQFDPIWFSVHSLRVGGASALRAGGATDSMIQLLGRWRSLFSLYGYMSGTLQEFVKMQQILANPKHLTSDVVRLMGVRPSGRSPLDSLSSGMQELDLTSEPHVL